MCVSSWLLLSLPGSYDIVLLQFSSAGSLLWTAQTGTAGDDVAYGNSVSADGQSVYVTDWVESSLHVQTWAGELVICY